LINLGDLSEVKKIFKYFKSLPYLQQKCWESTLSIIEKEIQSLEMPSTKSKMLEVYDSFKKRVIRDWQLLDWHSLSDYRNDMTNNLNERVNKNHKKYIIECHAVRSIDIISRTKEWLQCRSMDFRRIKPEYRLRHESHNLKKQALFAYASETLNVKRIFQKIVEIDF